MRNYNIERESCDSCWHVSFACAPPRSPHGTRVRARPAVRCTVGASETETECVEYQTAASLAPTAAMQEGTSVGMHLCRFRLPAGGRTADITRRKPADEFCVGFTVWKQCSVLSRGVGCWKGGICMRPLSKHQKSAVESIQLGTDVSPAN
jgi:hypothetical protein